MQDIFYVSLQVHDRIKKQQVDKTISQLKFEGDGKSKNYQIEIICNSAVYPKQSDSNYQSTP